MSEDTKKVVIQKMKVLRDVDQVYRETGISKKIIREIWKEHQRRFG